MSDWVGILREARVHLEHLSAEDGDPPPTDEAVLSYVVYSAIAEFIEHDDYRLFLDWLDDSYDYDAAINAWVDAAKPAATP